MNRDTCRKAAISHGCGRCYGKVEIGDLYLESVISPDHDDVGNSSWWSMSLCISCAVVCHREQSIQDYLLKHRKGQDAIT